MFYLREPGRYLGSTWTGREGGKGVSEGGEGRYGRHVVEMEMERREERGRRDRERERKKATRKPILYCTIPKQQKGKNQKYNRYTYTHIIHVHVQRYKYTYQRYPPSYLLPPKYHTNPSIRYTRHNTLPLHLPTPSLIDYHHLLQQYRSTYTWYIPIPSPTNINKPLGG